MLSAMPGVRLLRNTRLPRFAPDSMANRLGWGQDRLSSRIRSGCPSIGDMPAEPIPLVANGAAMFAPPISRVQANDAAVPANRGAKPLSALRQRSSLAADGRLQALKPALTPHAKSQQPSRRTERLGEGEIGDQEEPEAGQEQGSSLNWDFNRIPVFGSDGVTPSPHWFRKPNAGMESGGGSSAGPFLTSARGGLLQRKCACGKHVSSGGTCEECRKRAHDLQAKLMVSGPEDAYEQEANRIADQVLAGRAHARSGALPEIRRVSGQPNTSHDAAPPSVDHALAGAGNPLAPALRQDMEQRFGYDFSQVRVHSGAAAEQSAQDVDAHAYTVGRNIVFGRGQYAPQTMDGRRLLAHELTHVVQQDGGSTGGLGSARVQRFSLDELRQQKQFLSDVKASVKESPQHVGEFLVGEVWEAIKEHYVRIIVVTGGLVGLELIISALTAAPEPVITKIIAAILQIVVLAILGYFAAVELVGAYSEGREWLSNAKNANGDPVGITKASRSFVRMIWHIVMAVLVLAGLRAKLRGTKLPPAGGEAPSPPPASSSAVSGPAAAAGEGGRVFEISSHPKYRPPPTASASAESPAFGPRGEALKIQPAQQPLPEPLPAPPAPAPAPAIAKGPAASAGKGPGVHPASAGAAGLSEATSKKEKPKPDLCEKLLGLRPGINDRRLRQRAPSAGQITVSEVAYRLDKGINPPAGQDTTPASRDWVRSIGLPDDDAGHVIGNRFGGRADFNAPRGNIFPQDLSFNRGTMRSYDDRIAELHQRGDVCALIKLEYESALALRPSNAWYTYIYRSPGATGFNPPIGPVQVPNRGPSEFNPPADPAQVPTNE
jgi:Domain of unknown function (DUF4157)/DNA/RNA non-specific endonuclease